MGIPGIFLGADVNGAETEFEILDINYNDCNQTDDAFVMFELPADGPFSISCINKFVIMGCRSEGSFKVSNGGVTCRTTKCINQFDPIYCNNYGCCESGVPGNEKVINLMGEGISYEDFPGACGFSTMLDPATWEIPEGESGLFGRGHYGLRPDWGIGHGTCSTANLQL